MIINEEKSNYELQVYNFRLISRSLSRPDRNFHSKWLQMYTFYPLSARLFACLPELRVHSCFSFSVFVVVSNFSAAIH